MLNFLATKYCIKIRFFYTDNFPDFAQLQLNGTQLQYYICAMLIAIVIAAGEKSVYTSLLLAKLKEQAASNNFLWIDAAQHNFQNKQNAVVVLEEKPGPIGRLRQKRWLKKASPDLVLWIDTYQPLNGSASTIILFTDSKNAEGIKGIADAQAAIYTISKAEQQQLATLLSNKQHIAPLYLFSCFKNEDRSPSVADDGLEGNYFYCDITTLNDEDVIRVWKAFSAFKKWQLSGMKLMLKGALNQHLQSKLDSFKYRSDVLIDVNGSARFGSYAVIFPRNIPSLYPEIYPNLNAGLAVIAGDTDSFKEVYGNSIYYCDVEDDKQLSTAMVEIYKREEWVEELRNEAATVVTEWKARNEIQTFWQKLIHCAEQKH